MTENQTKSLRETIDRLVRVAGDLECVAASLEQANKDAICAIKACSQAVHMAIGDVQQALQPPATLPANRMEWNG